MRVRGWPVIVIVGVSLTVIAISQRECIQDIVGGRGAHPEHLAYGFDGTVSSATLATARDLIADRLTGMPVNVHVEGDQIVIDTESAVDSFTVVQVIDADLAARPHLEVSILDYESEYLEKLAKHTWTAKAAADLGITAELDHLGHYLRVPNAGKYVNEAWALRHQCDTKDRLTGTGIYCWVDPADRIAAYFHGDAELFIDPLPTELALPADRDLLADSRTDDKEADTYKGHGSWKYYLVERGPIVLDQTTVAGVSHTTTDVTLALNQRGRDQVAARATGSTVELVTLIAGQLKEVHLATTPGGGATIAIESAPAFGAELEHALAVAALPRRLHSLPDP